MYNVTKLPFNLKTEKVVLSALLTNNKYSNDIICFINTEYFSNFKHKKIYNAIFETYIYGGEINLESIFKNIKDSKTNNFAKMKKYIQRLSENDVSVEMAKKCSEIVFNDAILRKIIMDIEEIKKSCYYKDAKAKTILDNTIRKMLWIIKSHNNENFSTILHTMLCIIERTKRNTNITRKSEKTLETELLDIDNFINGLENSKLIVLKSPQMVFKIITLLYLVQKISLKTNKTIVVFSSEVSKELMVEKMLSIESFVNFQEFDLDNMNESNLESLSESIDFLSKSNIIFDNSESISFSELWAKLSRVINLGLIIIDNFEAFKNQITSDETNENEADIEQSLNIMIKDLNAPIICFL